MTPADIQLLADIAGGFNYSRVGKPPTTRFDNSASWAKADALNELVQRLEGPVEPPVTDLPVSVGAPYYEGYPDFSVSADRVVAIPFTGPGRVSVSVPDGVKVWLGVGVPGAFVEPLASAANGTALVHVANAGAYHANVKLDPGMSPCKANLYIGTV